VKKHISTGSNSSQTGFFAPRSAEVNALVINGEIFIKRDKVGTRLLGIELLIHLLNATVQLTTAGIVGPFSVRVSTDGDALGSLDSKDV
jgi:hypothetical protein